MADSKRWHFTVHVWQRPFILGGKGTDLYLLNEGKVEACTLHDQTQFDAQSIKELVIHKKQIKDKTLQIFTANADGSPGVEIKDSKFPCAENICVVMY